MKLQVIGITDRGVIASERVILRVAVPFDLSYAVIFNSHYLNANTIASGIGASFWFPPKLVDVGDFVVIYTRSGTASTENHLDGRYHYFYQNMPNALFSIDERCAVVFELNTWQTTIAPAPTYGVPPGLRGSLP